MKITKLFFALFGLFLSTSLAAQLPDITVKTLDGQSVNIQQYANDGKITVLSFWATWCSPCKRELDALADLYPDWQEDYNVEIVAVTIDNARALSKVKPMVSTKGWDYTILSDANEELRRAMNFQSVPMTFLLDKEGKIVYTHNSYTAGDEYELEDKIKAIAGEWN